MTDSPWDDAYDIDVSEEARSALDRAIAVFDGLGHGVEAMAPEPEPGYPAAFRTIWQAGAATIPVDGEAEALLEPLTRWLLERGRAAARPASSPRRSRGSRGSRSASSADSRRSTPC